MPPAAASKSYVEGANTPDDEEDDEDDEASAATAPCPSGAAGEAAADEGGGDGDRPRATGAPMSERRPSNGTARRIAAMQEAQRLVSSSPPASPMTPRPLPPMPRPPAASRGSTLLPAGGPTWAQKQRSQTS